MEMLHQTYTWAENSSFRMSRESQTLIGLGTLDLNVSPCDECAELAVWVHLSLQHNTVVLYLVSRSYLSIEAGGRSPIDFRGLWLFSQEFIPGDKARGHVKALAPGLRNCG